MKVKKFISDTLKYWYIYLMVFGLLEIINYGVLDIFFPEKVCFWISAFLVVLLSVYLYLALDLVCNNVFSFVKSKHQELNQTIEDLRNHIDELDGENIRLLKELADAVHNDVKVGYDEVINTICENLTESKDSIIDKVRENSNDLKQAIGDSTNVLVNKSDELMKTQNENTGEIIGNHKKTVSELEISVNNKIDFAAEQNENAVNKLSSDLESQNQEKTDGIIFEIGEAVRKTTETINEIHKIETDCLNRNQAEIIATIGNAEQKLSKECEQGLLSVKMIDEKLDDKFGANEANNAELGKKTTEKIELAKNNILEMISSVKEKASEEHTERLKKVEDIVEMNNLLAKHQEEFANETERKLCELKESNEQQISLARESIAKVIGDASAEEIKAIKETEERISSGLEETRKTQSMQVANLEQNLEEKVRTIVQTTSKELGTSIREQMEELNNNYTEFKKVFDLNITRFENKTIELHCETTKLINSLLDNVDDYSDKNERYINLLNGQLTEASKNNKNGIANILKAVEDNKQQIENNVTKLNEYAETQKIQSIESEKSIKEYIGALNDYYEKCFDKINNIQYEISGISCAVSILSNIYSLSQSGAKESKDSIEPNRIEEFKDAESGAVVKNHYKHDKLSFSEMIVDGRKTYDIQYSDEGKALISRSYNRQDEIVSEVEFYKNGQVKTRKENFMKNGKKETIISKFDEKGNKII